MGISSIYDNQNSSILNNILNSNNQKSGDSLFAAHSQMQNEFQERVELEGEDTAATGMSQDEFESLILTSSDFSMNVMELIEEGKSFTDAVKETKQEQYEDLFEQRLAANGGDVTEAANYAKSMMSAELTEEELYEIMQTTAANMQIDNKEVANELQELAKVLYDKINAEKETQIGLNEDEEKEAENGTIITSKTKTTNENALTNRIMQNMYYGMENKNSTLSQSQSEQYKRSIFV